MESYVFFIGGSGARAYKAFLHLCGAGVIQNRELNVLLLDADNNNMACEESIRLYKEYEEHRKLLYQTGGKKTSAFSCCINMNESVITPVKRDRQYLGQVVTRDVSSERVMKWLYTKTEREQTLTNGFYAHPNIGCIFFQNLQDENLTGYVRSIEGKLRNGEDIKVVLVGSIFGGTGAAGIPSLLKYIYGELRSRCEGDELKRLHSCGVLITPYFSIAEKKTKDNDITVEDKYFYYNTREALRYYDFFRESDEDSTREKFEAIYITGQKDLDIVNREYAAGGMKQQNKPHIVEVYSALAIKDFLENDGRNKIYMNILEGEVGWSAFTEDMNRLADMIRAQMVLATAIYPYVDKQKEKERKWNVYQWYKVYNLDRNSNRTDMDKMRKYTTEFLDWLYKMQISLQDPERVQIDSRIRLCGPVIMDIKINMSDKEDNPYKDIWSRFNEIVDTTSNIEYVLNKIELILSYLGIVWKPAKAMRGCAGLFITLLERVKEKNKV